MTSVRFTDVQARPTEFLDLTSLTLEEFQQLVPPFEAAFHAHMAGWRLDGKPPHRAPVYGVQELPLSDAGRSAVLHSGLPENLCPPGGARAHVRHGPEQSQPMDSYALTRSAGGSAHPRRCPGSFPDGPRPAARCLEGRRRLRRRLVGGGAGTRRPASLPLLPMTGRNDVLSAPKTLLNRKRVIAARKKTTR
jgi:hypothetical protein